jgi:hypothetical protein
MKWLEYIKSGGEEKEVLDQDYSSTEWEKNSSNCTVNLSQQEQEAIKNGIEADVQFTNIVMDLPAMGDHEIDRQKDREENDLNGPKNFAFLEEENKPKPFVDISNEEMKKISSIAREIVGDKLSEIKKYYNDDFGYFIEITLDQNDKDAFETWFSIIDRIETLNMDAKVIVNWTRENILDDNELTQKMIDAMLRLDIAPKRNDRFNAAEEAYQGGF